MINSQEVSSRERSQSSDIKGSYWFKRLYREATRLSPHLRFKRIKLGFYRIYWREAYVHEVYSEMPMIGYDYEDEDPRFENRKYYEEYEDQAELTRKVKNYMEGYYDAIDHIRKRIYLMRNDKDFYKEARQAYKQMRVT